MQKCKENGKKKSTHLSLRSMLSVIHDLQTTTRFTTHGLLPQPFTCRHVYLDKINVLFYYIFFDPSGKKIFFYRSSDSPKLSCLLYNTLVVWCTNHQSRTQPRNTSLCHARFRETNLSPVFHTFQSQNVSLHLHSHFFFLFEHVFCSSKILLIQYYNNTPMNHSNQRPPYFFFFFLPFFALASSAAMMRALALAPIVLALLRAVLIWR